MARITDEEAKKRRLSDQNNNRVKKYYEIHRLITFGAKIDEEKYHEITTALKDSGITQKQFIEDAIDEFLKKTRN